MLVEMELKDKLYFGAKNFILHAYMGPSKSL